MGGEMVRQPIEKIVDQDFVGNAAAVALPQPVEESMPESVGGKEAVDIAAHDPAIHRSGAIRPAA